jgi:hypothetical protein
MSHSHDTHSAPVAVSPAEARFEIVLAILVAAIFLELPVYAPDAPANLLSLLLAVPMLGALAVLFIPRQWTAIIRRFSLAVMVIELWISAWLFHGDYSGSAYQFTQDVEWIPALGIRYSVGVDGISYWLVLLTTVLTPISLYVSFNSITTKTKEYAFSCRCTSSSASGAARTASTPRSSSSSTRWWAASSCWSPSCTWSRSTRRSRESTRSRSQTSSASS